MVLSLQSRPRKQVLISARVAVVTVSWASRWSPFCEKYRNLCFGTAFPFKLRVNLLLDASLNQASNLCGRQAIAIQTAFSPDPGCSEGFGINDFLSTLKPP